DGRDLVMPRLSGNVLGLIGRRDHRAREHRRTVDEYRARAARGVVTAALRARESQVIAERVEQQRAGLDGDLVAPPVDLQFDEFFLHLLLINYFTTETWRHGELQSCRPERSEGAFEYDESSTYWDSSPSASLGVRMTGQYLGTDGSI